MNILPVKGDLNALGESSGPSAGQNPRTTIFLMLFGTGVGDCPKKGVAQAMRVAKVVRKRNLIAFLEKGTVIFMIRGPDSKDSLGGRNVF